MSTSKFPKIIYRFVRYTGFEKDKSDSDYFCTLKDKNVFVGGKNPLEFIDEDSVFIQNKKPTPNIKQKSQFIANTVISFTESLDNEIWNKFMPDLDKLVIGISTEREYLTTIEETNGLKLKKVRYSNETIVAPEYYNGSVPNSAISEWIEQTITTKKKKFESEKEYRFFGKIKQYKSSAITRIISLPKKMIKEIILGCNMDKEEKEKVRTFCSENLPNTVIKETTLKSGKIQLTD